MNRCNRKVRLVMLESVLAHVEMTAFKIGARDSCAAQWVRGAGTGVKHDRETATTATIDGGRWNTAAHPLSPIESVGRAESIETGDRPETQPRAISTTQ
jgi:hypothetical protein